MNKRPDTRLFTSFRKRLAAQSQVAAAQEETAAAGGKETPEQLEQAAAHIRDKLALLPDAPGCYLMKSRIGTIIYVGKAKVLKNRVRSYFNGTHDGKTQRLVSEIRDFEYIVTASNVEALILECNLIKQHHPRYNVLLKDDKSFPYIKITNETHPRLEVTRRVHKDKAKYYGPYPNAYAAQQTLKLLERLYPLRKCKTMPDKVCLYYHIGQCLAPCEFPVEKQTYEGMVQEISSFLNGGHQEVKARVQQRMLEAAEALEFERAKELRDQLLAIDSIMEKQKINLSDALDRDVFGFAVEKGWMCVQILYMRQGKLIERHATTFPYYGEAYDDFMSFVTQYYSENPALPREIFLPQREDADRRLAGEGAVEEQEEATAVSSAVEEQHGLSSAGAAEQQEVRLSASDAASAARLDDAADGAEEQEVLPAGGDAEALQRWLKVKVHVPRRGRKKEVVGMACHNARIALEEKFKLIDRDEARSVKATEALAQWLDLPAIHRIEAFDNSNIQGVNPVSAMVVFIDGKPDKKEYRKFKIQTVRGPDDYDTMREVIRRRYTRVLKEGLAMPDLIVVDGGRGQLSAAIEVLEHELGLQVPVCGLVKDAKHKTAQLMTGDPPAVVPLPRDSQEFYLLQRIQEEVHRYAISFHREQRAKSMVASRLDEVPGIGEKRRKLLLKHFGSLKKIREARIEDFRQIGIGEKLAQKILETLAEEKED